MAANNAPIIKVGNAGVFLKISNATTKGVINTRGLRLKFWAMLYCTDWIVVKSGTP